MVRIEQNIAEMLQQKVSDFIGNRTLLVSDVTEFLKHNRWKGLTSRDFEINYNGKQQYVSHFAEVLKALGFNISWEQYGTGGCYKVSNKNPDLERAQ